MVIGVVTTRLLALALSEPSPWLLDAGRQEDGSVKAWKIARRAGKLLWDGRRVLPGVIRQRPQPARILDMDRPVRRRCEVPRVPQVCGEEQGSRFDRPGLR